MQKEYAKENLGTNNDQIRFKFNPEKMSVICSCKPNKKILMKQAFNKEHTLVNAIPCAQGFDDCHTMNVFLTPDLHISSLNRQPVE